MASNKIRLKTSASAIVNAKAAGGKKKVLPKLKVILANPYKTQNVQLSEDELSKFIALISSQISSCSMPGRQFVRENNIQLGLGSSLRAINNSKAACVMISLSIKPKFIIDQIGYLLKQKNSHAPVYVVDKLETLAENLFGVKALVVVFPLNISGTIGKWITERSAPSKQVKNTITENTPIQTPLRRNRDDKINLNSIYLQKKSNYERTFVPEVVVKSEEPILIAPSKDWTGDYISFSNTTEEAEAMDVDDEEFRRKHNRVLDGLGKLAESVSIANTNSVASKNHKFKPKQETAKPSSNVKQAKTDHEEWENDADFDYLGLEVLKIQPNPNRKQKTKRKSKKNKKKV